MDDLRGLKGGQGSDKTSSFFFVLLFYKRHENLVSLVGVFRIKSSRFGVRDEVSWCSEYENSSFFLLFLLVQMLRVLGNGRGNLWKPLFKACYCQQSLLHLFCNSAKKFFQSVLIRVVLVFIRIPYFHRKND